jgi:hypothetical protein
MSEPRVLSEEEQQLMEIEPDALLADGLHEAYMGYAQDIATGGIRAVYDRERCIQLLVRDGMSREDAEEHFSFNTEGAYVGPHTPLYVEVQCRR